MSTRYLSILIALVATAPVLADEAMERAVETAARNFRIQTYETYRTDRPVYDERIEAANEALRRFQFAADDVGRIEMRQWFFQAGQAEDATLSPIPEIQLVESRKRLQSSAPLFGQPKVKQNTESNTPRRDGFVVTEYDTNPRFESRRQNEEERYQQKQDALVNSDGNESVITKALKNPGELFSNIGKSFLRGDDQPDSDGSATKQAPERLADDGSSAHLDTESIEVESTDGDEAMQNALDDIIATDSEQNDFDDLNNRIVGQNLAIGLLAEDFHGDDLKSIEFLGQCVDRLEQLNATQVEISEQRNLFNADQQNEFTTLNSLEEITTELMTAVNESATLLSVGEIEDEDGSIEKTLGDLRMRLSQVLAEHSF